MPTRPERPNVLLGEYLTRISLLEIGETPTHIEKHHVERAAEIFNSQLPRKYEDVQVLPRWLRGYVGGQQPLSKSNFKYWVEGRLGTNPALMTKADVNEFSKVWPQKYKGCIAIELLNELPDEPLSSFWKEFRLDSAGWYPPPALPPDFIERPALRDELLEKGKNCVENRQLLIVSGDSGVGKATLLIEFCNQKDTRRQFFRQVWINGKSNQLSVWLSLLALYLFPASHQPDEKEYENPSLFFARLKTHWNERNILLVLLGCECKELIEQLRDELPPGCLAVVTVSPQFANNLQVSLQTHVRVEPFHELEAVQFARTFFWNKFQIAIKDDDSDSIVHFARKTENNLDALQVLLAVIGQRQLAWGDAIERFNDLEQPPESWKLDAYLYQVVQFAYQLLPQETQKVFRWIGALPWVAEYDIEIFTFLMDTPQKTIKEHFDCLVQCELIQPLGSALNKIEQEREEIKSWKISEAHHQWAVRELSKLPNELHQAQKWDKRVEKWQKWTEYRELLYLYRNQPQRWRKIGRYSSRAGEILNQARIRSSSSHFSKPLLIRIWESDSSVLTLFENMVMNEVNETIKRSTRRISLVAVIICLIGILSGALLMLGQNLTIIPIALAAGFLLLILAIFTDWTLAYSEIIRTIYERIHRTQSSILEEGDLELIHFDKSLNAK
jgi:hypothetical protein